MLHTPHLPFLLSLPAFLCLTSFFHPQVSVDSSLPCVPPGHVLTGLGARQALHLAKAWTASRIWLQNVRHPEEAWPSKAGWGSLCDVSTALGNTSIT